MQATRNKMNSVQILRGCVFFTILLFHCSVPFSDIFWGGIECFFLLSAFFLTRKLLNVQTISVKEQFAHRIQRLILPYALVLVAAALRALLFREIPYDFIPHILFGQNFLWIKTGYVSPMQPMTGHLWTMTIEVWVGFVWLILLKILPRKNLKRAMYLCLAGSIVIRTVSILMGCDTLVLTLNPVSHLDAFALGSILAVELAEENTHKSRMPAVCGVLGLIGLLASVAFLAFANHVDVLTAYTMLDDKACYLTNPVSGNIYLYLALIFCWLVAYLYKKDADSAAKENWLSRLLVHIGNRSYVLYLFHWPVLWFWKSIWSRFPIRGVERWLFLLVLGTAFSLLATVVFERYIEPLLKK